ncbi:MAG TPA: carotenoid biosynthesis protein [Candidatus Binatia bacterium]|nr:carotenoid biosynthesis protein [Candidatus Binatia bacterium]
MQFIPGLFLIIQAGIVVASLLGYGIFTSRPDLLVQVDPQARFFTWAFHGFAVGNMLFGGLAVVAESVLHDRKPAIVALAAIYVVSLASEWLGTTYGIPFGAYSYTTLLGPKWFDRVPLLIPLSWFTMSWAVWIIACRRTRGFQVVLLGTCLLVAWDLLLDPAMSRVTSYWIWGEKGNYYGMPWTNLLGWAITGFVLLVMLRKLAPEPKGDLRFSILVYFVNFLLPLGFCVLNGYWIAVGAGIGAAVAALVVFGPGKASRLSQPASPELSTQPHIF